MLYNIYTVDRDLKFGTYLTAHDVRVGIISDLYLYSTVYIQYLVELYRAIQL